jgi:hypothetical protein
MVFHLQYEYGFDLECFENIKTNKQNTFKTFQHEVAVMNSLTLAIKTPVASPIIITSMNQNI